MEYAAFFLLFGGVAWLWRKVDALESEVARLRSGLIAPQTPAADAPPAPAMRPSVPLVASSQDPDPAPPEDATVAPVAVEETPHRKRSFDFEDLFGRMLPIWAGGVTLAVAGFFLVRWSIDAGLLTPPVRVVLAGLFGIALIAGAEAAYRWRERVADPRVAQALAGAGLATLYAAFYLAGSTYGLITAGAAFVGLMAVTAAAIGLSFRFGLPSAVLALVGGFAAPALVASENANLPLLTIYLAMVTVGIGWAGNRQGRAWLGAAALAGALGWGALLVLEAAANGQGDIVMLGAFLALLGGVLPAFLGGANGFYRWGRVAATGIAALQLAVLVAQGGFGPLEWGLYLLLGAALAWFGWRMPAMREGGAVAATIVILLLLVWTGPTPWFFASVAAAIAAIFALPPLARLWRGTGFRLDVAQAAGVALGLALAVHWHFVSFPRGAPQVVVALALAGVAVLPALVSHWAGRAGNGAGVRSIWAAQAAAALIAYAALAQVLPLQAMAWAAGLLALAAAWRSATFAGALAMFACLAALWAIGPAVRWAEAGLQAIGGMPMAMTGMPTVRAVFLNAAPAAVALGAWRLLAPPQTNWVRRLLGASAVAVTAIAAHTIYRHAFAAMAGTDFVATGVLERAVWEGLLLGLGWLALKRGWGRVAAIAAILATAHFAWFALVLHNPLWSMQAVGPLPLTNALLPMYAAGFAALWLAAKLLPARAAWPRWAIQAGIVLLAALFTLSELRQAFAGSLLATGPVSQSEDLLRSLAGIVLAAAFLAWGARTGSRSWRIGSLVLMVIAVLKVFLVDAAGLEGLSRIASFMALGFSLIGIGWFYNRQLRTPQESLPTSVT
ncbi:DUF2339 domain-containing protein [Tsuneonella amylolytica]|uniref:DUF2339 domain-containing protein n=1 Tax=Tsuneonella amylolytica TaxID=2338327 RepID=UPI000EA891FC|nr:DUF2339 domain-containing protein [Tsuneonella amylolytica]